MVGVHLEIADVLLLLLLLYSDGLRLLLLLLRRRILLRCDNLFIDLGIRRLLICLVFDLALLLGGIIALLLFSLDLCIVLDLCIIRRGGVPRANVRNVRLVVLDLDRKSVV